MARDDLLERRTATGLVALPPTGAPVCLNHTATFIWEHLRAKTPLPELVSIIERTFDLSSEESEIALSTAIRQLVDQGLAVPR